MARISPRTSAPVAASPFSASWIALLLVAVGVVVIFTSGWTSGLPPITVGLALLVVDLATWRRQGGPTRS